MTPPLITGLTAAEIEARFAEPAPDAECAAAVMATVH